MALAAVLAGLTLTERIEVWHVVVLATLLGVVTAFEGRRARRSRWRWSGARIC